MGPRRSGDRGGMSKLLQISLKAATVVVRTSAQLVEVVLDRVRGGGRRDEARWTPAPPSSRSAPPAPREPWTDAAPPMPEPAPPAPAAAAPPPPAAVPEPPPPAAEPPDVPPIAVVPEPTPGQAARIREQQREAETTPDSPGAEVHVDEP
jgi:hypothetical protein